MGCCYDRRMKRRAGAAAEPDLFTIRETGEDFVPADPGVEMRDGSPVYAVSKLAAELKDLLETAHPAVYVRGEVSGFRLIQGSGHMYFDLKDEKDFINAAFFKGANRKLQFDLEDGMEVIAFGRVSLFRS